MAKPKLERTMVYVVDGVTYVSKPQALVAKARFDLGNMVLEASYNGKPLFDDDALVSIPEWMLNNANTLRKLLNTYVQNSAVVAAERDDAASEGENTDGDE